MNIVRKILDHIRKAFLYTKTHWKRILGLLLLVGLSALFALKTSPALSTNLTANVQWAAGTI
jgi:hypothetical protein